MAPPRRWQIPPTIWWILVTWGASILVLIGAGLWWTDRAIVRNEREQDRQDCMTITVLTAGPEPVPGPAGDRARFVREALNEFRRTLDCEEAP
jgi:hypothetical protein